MRFLTYVDPRSNRISYGALFRERYVVDLERLLADALVREYDLDPWNAREVSGSIFSSRSRYVIQRIEVFKPLLEKSIADLEKRDLGELVREGFVLDIDSVRFLPPIYDPGKIVGIIANYEEYRTMLKYPKPEVPIFFFKPPSTLVGHKDYVTIPRGGRWPGTSSKVVFHEYELALVIGRRVRNVSRWDAYKYVYGFTIFSDLTAHDIEMISPGYVLYQQRSKAFDTFSPMGPWIVTMDEIVRNSIDIHNLRIVRKRNNVIEGESNTRNMIYKAWEVIEFLSEVMTLEPGDIISLGSPPAGPPEGIQPGDTIEAYIEFIGSLVNFVR